MSQVKLQPQSNQELLTSLEWKQKYNSICSQPLKFKLQAVRSTSHKKSAYQSTLDGKFIMSDIAHNKKETPKIKAANNIL